MKKQIAGLSLQFWIVKLTAFINAVSFTIIIPVIYPYAKQFGLSDFQASLLTTAYAGSQFLGTPILGSLSDRFGRKPLLILSLAGTVAANLVASLTLFAWLLFAARALDGLTGGNTSVARAVVSDITDREQRTRAFGIFGATFRLGFVAGPPLSFLAQSVPPLPGVSSLGISFLVAGSTAVIAVLLCLFLLPETHTMTDRDESRQLLDFGLNEIFSTTKNEKFRYIFFLTFLSGLSFTIFTFAFQPFFLNVLNQESKQLAIVFAAIGLLGFLSQILALDPVQQRFQRLQIFSVTVAVRGAVFLLLPIFPNVVMFAILMAIFGLINSFPMPLIDSILSLRSTDKEQGEILGINSAYLSFANALGPAISGVLVGINYSFPFWITGVMTLAIAVYATTVCGQTNLADGS
ncbi:MAG: MFS transporter [Cyanobacteria bacterium P01_E01_bin.48]